MTESIETCLGKFTDAQVWERQGSQENAVGNLILHLCGNVRQWISHGVGREQDIRVRDEEFNATEGLTAAELKQRLRETVDHAIAIIGSVTAERLAERIVPQGRDVSVLEAIYQVVGHFQQHAGQIQFITKRVTGEKLS